MEGIGSVDKQARKPSRDGIFSVPFMICLIHQERVETICTVPILSHKQVAGGNAQNKPVGDFSRSSGSTTDHRGWWGWASLPLAPCSRRSSSWHQFRLPSHQIIYHVTQSKSLGGNNAHLISGPVSENFPPPFLGKTSETELEDPLPDHGSSGQTASGHLEPALGFGGEMSLHEWLRIHSRCFSILATH